MPQMSPLNWLLLFIIFFTTYITFLILNYFNKYPMNISNIQLKLIKSTFLIWKW
uniref:ATP synthase complex subunit 8 n=1 Tax=Pedetontus silvestrii TaxID=518099 RepID=B7SSK6_9INSE|nr:ATP synthase F0 subunit 8 [Pedetontus silvestrii]ACC60218.1 ATP synthase F0 subunit 8 [Pedetontus silvestrii]